MEKTFLCILISVVCVLGGIHKADAQRNQSTGEPHAKVHALLVSGENLFAGTLHGGVFLSTNGETWINKSSGLTNFDVECLAVSGNNIFAGTWGGGVFLSTNNGEAWRPVNSGLEGWQMFVNRLTMCGSTLFASNSRWFEGIFEYNNKSWIQRSDTTSEWIAICMTEIRRKAQARTFYKDDTTYVIADYRSTDNGETWPIKSLSNTTVHAIVVRANRLFAGTDDGVFRSTDNGETWIDVSSGLTNIDKREQQLSVGVLTSWSSLTNGQLGYGLIWTSPYSGLDDPQPRFYHDHGLFLLLGNEPAAAVRYIYTLEYATDQYRDYSSGLSIGASFYYGARANSSTKDKPSWAAAPVLSLSEKFKSPNGVVVAFDFGRRFFFDLPSHQDFFGLRIVLLYPP